MLHQIALGLQKILPGEFECEMTYIKSNRDAPFGAEGVGLTPVTKLCREPFTNGAACPQQADAHSRFGPAMGTGDLLHFVALQIVPLQHQPVVLLAGLENPSD